jgi:hypothetical protein
MLKICKDKWHKNSKKLYEEIVKRGTNVHYIDLVRMSVNCVLNEGETDYETWDTDNITVIDNGDYQGTLLFMIPRRVYQPSEYDYLLTFAGYGSCSGCDALLSIIEFRDDEMTEDIAKDLLMLCKHLIENIVKPYNGGWREDEDYTAVVEKRN